MKNKREVQSEQTRTLIINEAMKLFVQKGFTGTSISDLAGAVHLTKGALYHHFDNKEAILIAVIEQIRTTWRKEVGRRVMQAKDAVSQLTELFEGQAKLISKNQAFCLVLNVLLTEMGAINPSFHALIENVYNDLLQFTKGILEQGQKNGQVRLDLDCNEMACAIVGILRGTGCSQAIFSRLGADFVKVMLSAGQIVNEGVKA